MFELHIRSGGIRTRSIGLLPGVNRIGRDSANDHVLEDSSISGRHCDIVVLNEGVFVRDLNSTNGTFIDGQPVKEASLQAGQTLQLGVVELILEEPTAHVAIPSLAFQQQTLNPTLPDGQAACVNHPASCGIMQCGQCQKVFCELCIHQVRRVGGVPLKLCPSCGARCQAVVRDSGEKKRRSLFGAWLCRITRKMTGRFMRVSAE